MAHQFKARVDQEVLDVLASPCEEVVYAQYLVSLGEQSFAKMRA